MDIHSNTVARVLTPSATGFLLVAFAYALKYCPPLSWLVAHTAGLFNLRSLPKELLDLDPMNIALPPSDFKPRHPQHGPSLSIEDIYKHASGHSRVGLASFAAFHAAYLSGSKTPGKVIEALLAKLGLDSHLSQSRADARGYFASVIPSEVVRQAEASTARYAAKAPLSPLDGVPVVIKNELDIQGHETRAGSSFINAGNPAKDDGAVAKQLMDLGMIVLGATNMTEVGWSTVDIRFSNPWKLRHSCGGSSSGTAACVAAGYAPIGIGVDGGGSVRIPSGLSGLYGLKPTHKRVSSRGEYCSCPTVAITGPIGATADDLAVGYLAIGDHSAPGMPVHIPRNYFGFDVSDLRIGVIRAYNAQVFNPAITAALTRVEDELVKRGATVVDISFPYLELVRQAHVITISSELYSAITSDPNSQQMQFGTVALCSAFRHLSVKDYIHAQKLRTHAIHVLRNVFSRVDFLMSPTAAVTAPAFPRDTWAGISDTTLVTDIMRFSFLANFAGTPAVTCPVGLDDSGLPVAVQFMGEWWSEGRLCALAKWMEGEFASLNEARAPGWDGVGF